MTSNIEVAQGGGKDVSAKTVLSYAVLAYSLPPGHVFQSRIDGLEGYADLTTSQENISRAVREWANPDVDSPKKATAVALGEKVKTKAPRAKETSVTVLNGNGVTGSASNASYLLGQRGYPILTPPNGIPANAPSLRLLPHARSTSTRSRRARSRPRRRWRASSARPTSQKATPAIAALANDAMLTAVVGQTFHGTLAAAPGRPDAEARARERRSRAPRASLDLLTERQTKVDFPLMVPTVHRAVVLDRSRATDPALPVRRQGQAQDDPAHVQDGLERLLGRPGDRTGTTAPVLGEPQLHPQHRRPAATSSTTTARTCTWSCCNRKGATYWVVNTLLDRLSNETMIAIAKGLRPIAQGHRPRSAAPRATRGRVRCRPS